MAHKYLASGATEQLAKLEEVQRGSHQHLPMKQVPCVPHESEQEYVSPLMPAVASDAQYIVSNSVDIHM